MRRAALLVVTLATATLAAPAPAAAQAVHGVGQFFTAPTTDAYLASVFTGSLHVVSGGTYTMLLLPMSGMTVSGPAAFTLASVPGPIAEDRTVPVGVFLTPGARYAFLMQADPSGDPVGFRGTFGADALAGAEAGFCNGSGVCTAWSGDRDFDRFALTFTAGPTAVVPEPATTALLGGGLLALAGMARRRPRA